MLGLYLAMILKRPELLRIMYSRIIFINIFLCVLYNFYSGWLQLFCSCPPPKTYSKVQEVVTPKTLASRASWHLILFAFLGTRIECQVIWI